MVLFSIPDAVREVFRLDPAIAPAGQSWEFLRPFAGRALDPAARRRRAPARAAAAAAAVSRGADARVHADGSRARAARARDLERARGRARADAAADARDHPAGRVRRRSDEEAARLRDAIDDTLAGVRSLPRMLVDGRRAARPRAAQPVGSLPGRGRALRRAAARPDRPPPGRRRTATRCSSLLLEQRDEDGQARRPTATSATSSSRCSSAATTARRPRWPGRLSGSPAIPRSTRGCATAIPPTSTRSSRRCCACGRR